MKCTCPKCQERVELDLPEISEEGTVTSCPNCKATMTVCSESFGARALRKTGEVSCASCGNELGPQIYCETCGISYPPYLVHSLGRKKSRKGTKVQLKSSPFFKSKSASQRPLEALPSLDGTVLPTKTQTASRKYPKEMMIGVAVLVLLVASVGGWSFYSKWKTENAYMKHFARATYGVQVGMDLSRKVCQRIATDWKASVDTGQPFVPAPTAQDEKELNSVRSKIDQLKPKFSQEPPKFQNSNQRLAKLEGLYGKMEKLALAPGNSLPAFTEAIGKVDAEYAQAAKEFKSGIPAPLLEELQSASEVYRPLKTLLQ